MKYILNLIIFIIVLTTLNSCSNQEEVKSSHAGVDINSVSETEVADTETITSETTVNNIGNIYSEESLKRITIKDNDNKLSVDQISEIESF